MKEVIDTSPSRRQVLRLAAVVTACAVAAKAPNAAEPPRGETNSYVPADGTATFESVWQTVRDRFYDPRHNGLDWLAVRERYLPEVQRAASGDSLARVINSMLSELHASHTRFYTPDEPEYYQLADIFSGALRRRGLQRAFPDGRVSYPGIGIISRIEVAGRNTITAVIDGTPAQQAGLRVGDEILAADGTAFESVESFRGKVGETVALEVQRGASVVQIPVRPVDLEPTKMFLRGLESSARIIESNGRRIGYVHVWCYAGSVYQRALVSLLSQGVLRDADALILDLRDGWGGAQPEYLDLFNPRAPTMQVTGRSGTSEFVNVKWRKPVAMLINGGTRSGKEVLAYGFKKYRLGELIGTRTEGAVLAATAFLIGGGLLLLAVEDVRVDGERLEGVGVTPTIEVPAGAAPAGSDDPQLSRAVAVLSGT
ncbi:carboxyl-terminal processing protease [Bradyrhizobium sp. Rc2d]|uniref:S41 family peptidase n=1 Tax=Bradyrhizobium sp. Rc2d TaxID=1855321 RepID=UPI00088779A2|nr:S41 family peptidase [Bradyrhizobium sp. Rc2d]SDJ54319.1 carboxyl-terminal processing protease [Bradyrhizobium sp. Rc2d]